MTNGRTRLKLSISVDNGEHLVPVALSATGGEELKHIDLRGYAPKRLRALCIFLLLAKDRDFLRYEYVRPYKFYSGTRKRTWIGTLAAFDQRGQAIDALFTDYLFVPRFWKGMRGGAKGPHVTFLTNVLATEDLDLKGVFGDGRNWRLRQSELRELAFRLEDEFVRKGEWDEPIVQRLIREAAILNAGTKLPALWQSKLARDQQFAPRPEDVLPPDSPLLESPDK